MIRLQHGKARVFVLQQRFIQDIDIRFYLDDRHEILNELDREQVYDDICDWLMRHVGR